MTAVEFDFVNSLRVLALVATLIVFISLSIRYGRAFRVMATGPRYYFASMLFMFITVSWDTVVLMVNSDDFSLRMLPLAIGLTFAVIYLLEPHTAFRKRAGKDPLNLDEVSDEVLELRQENHDLREALHQSIRQENAAKIKLMATEAMYEGVREKHRAAQVQDEDRELDRSREAAPKEDEEAR